MPTEPTTANAAEIILDVLRPDLEDGTIPSAATYARAALRAYLQLTFAHNIPAGQAAEQVDAALTELGHRGRITFGYGTGTLAEQPQRFIAGPYMRVLAADSTPHVIAIGADEDDLNWIDGIH